MGRVQVLDLNLILIQLTVVVDAIYDFLALSEGILMEANHVLVKRSN